MLNEIIAEPTFLSHSAILKGYIAGISTLLFGCRCINTPTPTPTSIHLFWV